MSNQKASFLVVANRLPVDSVTDADGNRHWRRSPGGLVTALHPVLQAEKGTWVGWAGNAGPAPEAFDLEGVRLHPVSISQAEVQRYYEGFSNASLWPLYHDAVETRTFRRSWWAAYEEVNQRFATIAAEEAAQNAVVWVQDYQLQLVPAMLRQMRPDLRIGFFLHIPFPPVELFMQMPQRVQILKGLLGADLVGFQRPFAAQNFLRLTKHLLGLQPRGHYVAVDDDLADERLVRAESFPISIDTATNESIAAEPEVIKRAEEIRNELGDPRTIILGVDRLDYTKGIELRLKAFRELLEDGELSVPDTVMVQVATPSRERVEHYMKLRNKVELEVGRINGDFGQVGGPAVHYLHQSYDRRELTALYRAADIMAVTPMRDGMNLVAKEYVSSRLDNTGALLLSEFAGAAGELHQAYQVNPHDMAALKQGFLEAMHASDTDKIKRMRAMRRHVRKHDVQRWARRFLSALGVPEQQALSRQCLGQRAEGTFTTVNEPT
ncbi:alpha,alpha-trehalose-phosphate synthase (UDP-forming) [Natronoglycomyces albus]|uniref:Trehalose-6-phosphate synthase n=1 Tax=Natronoglycomyces albus TaxID=2811108 RepID=A0A895XLP7_9ACTN|nr:trehalose-6-phosphate synthase [Natronoglycomyces albus]QSB06264.1 trehalose-6-phosphate synthase [Natronoglycomyces albus]